MNKDKSIKDLKQYNDKLKNQLEYSKIRVWCLERENQKLKSRIEKAVEYITNTEDMCYYGKCNDGDLLIEVEEDFKNDLLNILNGKE